MINRNESQLLAKEQSNRQARQAPAYGASKQVPEGLGLPKQSANDVQTLNAPKR